MTQKHIFTRSREFFVLFFIQLYLDLVDGISGFAINGKLNNGDFYF